MRVFLYEYCSAQAGARTSLPESLLREGRAMLAAVLEDFGKLPGVEPITLLAVPDDEKESFQRLTSKVDCALIIAPESDDLLWTRCRWVEEAGAKLLGPSSEAVRLTGDKFQLAEHLGKRYVPTPGCRILGHQGGPLDDRFPLICKPRHGAGSQSTFLVREAGDLQRCVATAREGGYRGELILQHFVAGVSVSVSFLIGPRQTLALMPASQTLSDDGRFRYLGGEVPLPAEFRSRAITLARRAVEAVPGLRGFVGVDLVLGHGDEDAVIEINPRLTTSYVGLRALTRANLAAAMLAVVYGEQPAQLNWRPGPVVFHADGRVWSG